MVSFRDLTLRRKLHLIVLLISAIAVLLTCGVLGGLEYITFKRAQFRSMAILADTVGANTQAALAFDDAEAAADLLQALQADPQVTCARVYDRADAPFADYPRSATIAPMPAIAPPLGSWAENGHMVVVRPIMMDGEAIGTILLRVDLGEVYRRLAVFAGVALLALIGAIVVAWTLTDRLQRVITNPILRLVGMTREVAEQGNYSVRAPENRKDEVGLLASSFNRMLGEIDAQNQALIAGEESLRSILDAALSAVVVIDAKGMIRDWNARAEAIFGWPRSEAIGSLAQPLFAPSGTQGADTAAFSFSSGSDSATHPIEITAIRRNGSHFPAEVAISPLTIDGTLHRCAFITDITDRKESERRVQAQIGRLDLLNRITRAIGDRQDLPSIFNVVIRSLEDQLPIDFGCVCLHDPAAETLTVCSVGLGGKETGLLPGTPIPPDANGVLPGLGATLLYDADASRITSPCAERLAQAGLHSMVMAPLAFESRTFGMLLVARRPTHAFSSPECEFLRQVSEHVGLAAHQAQLYSALQQAYDDLRQTQQTVMQQERLRALGQMASGIAHDINNAISPIMMYSEFLLEHEPGLSPKARNHLEIITRATDDVAHTVARLGEFYRQRPADLQLVPIDLNELVRQVVDLTRARWSDMPQQRGMVITVATALAPDLPRISGVPSELREALVNLVFNAVDAMPDGGTITLSTRYIQAEPVNSGRSRIEIAVGDTGTGMDEETRRRCLEPFYTTKGERGSGLGLAMVYGIIHRHQAELEIDSAPDQGTTIRIAFGLTTGSTVSSGDAPLQRPAQRLRLLVVDDDPLLLKSLREILESDGHFVTTAEHGRAGIEAFQRSLPRPEAQFAAVITDLGMPYVDGRAVAQAVKAALPDMPVILLTGWGQRMKAEGELPPHVDCILSKPPRIHELRAALAKHCRPAVDAT